MKKILSPISLKSVTNSDVKFLFDLLKERDPRVNISHRKMPTYSQHTKFIKSKPYSKWYIILKSKQKIGSIYLSKNDEIGIFLSKKFQGKNVGNSALNELIKKNPRKRFLANVNPKNKKSISFFKNNNFKLIQYTFEKAKRQ
jgi:RimJ/RimL family protein N-acetyltransferase